VEFVTKAGKTAVLVDENWQTLEQAASQRGARGAGLGSRGGFDPGTVTDFKSPVARALDYLAKASNLKRDGETVTGTFGPEAVTEMLAAGMVSRFGPRRGGARGRGEGTDRGRSGASGIRDATGSVTFWVKDGVLTKYALILGGRREFRDEEVRLERRTTTTIASGDGTANIAVSVDAKEIVDALAAGRTPNVFVPEPGFKKLFNGRDLAGWAGRPEHWSVEEGAITGRTTRDNPARGNNFLIAKKGDSNLIVDDFELRLSYRIIANNDRGFANSGIQYRSRELPNFVAAGYQADFEAGDRFSGILYDEGGGAGGRGIMAMRGQKVVWTVDGNREVTGQLGTSEEIQRAIRKDDWNDYTVIARGSHLRHFINGVQTVDVFDDTASKRLTSGILALQLHAGEPMTVQFKNIRIKSLSTVAETAAESVTTAKDFKLELLYTVPKETEGSWVTMCVDPRGRLIVGDQNGGLYRLTPPPVGQSGPVRPEAIEVDIGEAHGLLYAFDSLYVMVNEGNRRHGLYRVRDTDGDDRFDEVRLLRRINAAGEHGAHSLVLSPDGSSIYAAVGNQSTPTDFDSSRVPLNWSEDNLLTRIRTGFMDDSLAPQGWVARTDPDGLQWELIASGFRNQFDIAFNRAGELFTFDADMEWDIGVPWYRPTRVNHVISGAEFGFRNGSGKWPEDSIDSFGAVLNIGPGSPTGVTFGHGAKFPAKYQDALYICDWSFGKLIAIHLTPAGASYTGEAEEFVTGQPLPLTDVVINPHHGAMYFTVGGRQTQSALYRVTYVGSEATTPGGPDDRFAEERALRRRLETYHGRQDAQAVEAVWPYLGDQDRAIRYAARVALEWQDPGQWRERALVEQDARAAIAALVALARVSGRDEWHRKPTDPKPDPLLQERILAALDALQWERLGSSDRLDLMRAYALVFTRLGPPSEEMRQRLIAKFDLLPFTDSRELNASLANMLVYLQAPNAATKIMAALRTALTQEEQIDYVLALRKLETGWTMPLREEYFRWFVTKAPNYRGGNTFASSLRTIKNEAVAQLSEEEASLLQPILEAAPEQKSPAELLAARPFVKKWTLDELLPIIESGLQGGRNFDQGRKLYTEVACAACHRFDQDGGSVGPDLTALAGRFTPRDLLESLVEPSKVISDQYGAIVIEKKNGQVVTGRVGNLQGDSLQVIEDMFEPGRFTSVRRQEIESIRPSPVSMMPTGLLDSLQAEEIQDLVAYLLSRGDGSHPTFRQ
jgi:putative heme-binding domain-containing protein